MRSGNVGLSVTAGGFRYAGNEGLWWSSRTVSNTSTTSDKACNLYFNSMTVYPSHGPDYDWYGFPLRCLSTVWDREELRKTMTLLRAQRGSGIS